MTMTMMTPPPPPPSTSTGRKSYEDQHLGPTNRYINLVKKKYRQLTANGNSNIFHLFPFTPRLTQYFYFFIFIFFYLFMAVLGLRFCARAFSSCGKRGPLFIAVRGPLTIAASPVAEHRLQTRRLSNCGSRAQLLRGMWDLPRPELEPVSPALAGGFSTAAPPGKPQ